MKSNSKNKSRAKIPFLGDHDLPKNFISSTQNSASFKFVKIANGNIEDSELIEESYQLTVVTNVNTPIRLKFVFFPPPFQT